MPETEPRFSISQITTLTQSFDEDLLVYGEAGVDGIGIWEIKLREGEEDLLLAALANLLHNAFKFSANQGDIHLYISTGADGMARIRVTDTGRGIS